DNGIFAEIINPDFCSKKTISRCVTNISSIYKNRVVYFFSDAAVILASDSGDFAFNAQLYNKLTEMFSRRDELSRMFYNEEHFFSNLIETETLLSYLGGAKDNADDSANDEPAAGNELDKLYAEKNNLVLSTLSNEMPAFNQAAAVRFARDNQALTFLKESELAEASERYIDEMEFLFKLRTLSQYMPRLNLYIKNILAYKKDYYYNAALGFEKKKDWETAGKLYQAILALDKDNFEANYRLGLLSLTVQDMDSSFRYLQYALSLRKDDPKALTQMGILLFSTGRAADALRYLTQALERNEYTAQVFFYLGLVYEELGRLQESKQSYERAAVADPNDETIKTRLQNLNVKIQAEIDKWKMNSPKNEFESERGETIQLPVDKTSYDMRLDDNSPAEEGNIIGN
ncbi:MAG: tetratricopeptide repeat protein, partial [Spirochaetia bacterium]|nr:tetratricopeptide repeat protein [Spirochaetia bacterium]